MQSSVALSLVLAAAAVLATGAGAFWNMRAVTQATGWVAHTHEVQSALEQVLSLLKDVESGQRGYLLTGDDAYLQPYREATARIGPRLDRLQALTADNASQQARIAQMRQLASERLAVSEEIVRLMRQGDTGSAMAELRTGRGKRAMDSARLTWGAMRSEEDRLLAERIAAAQAISTRGQSFAALATALVLALLGTAYFAMRRAADSLRASAQSLRSSLASEQQSNRELAFQKYALDQAAIVAVTDAAGMLTYVNDKFCQVSGHTRDALLGLHHRRVLEHGQGPAELPEGLSATLAAGRTWRGEIRNQRKDGSTYWVDTTVVPLLDAQGQPERHVSISWDITERKQAEQALRRSQALTQAIIEGSTALVYAKDLQGRYFLANQAWCSLLHLTPDAVAGLDDVQAFGPGVAQRLRAIDERVAATGEPLVIEESAVIHGRALTYLSSKFPLRDADGSIYAVCGISTDITDLKTAQQEVLHLNQALEERVAERTRQLTEANEELEAFSYTVSHDLRAPLRGLQGFAQAVQEDHGDRLDAEGRDYLARIVAAARRMEELIRDLLDYGRLARETLQLRHIHLGTAVAEALERVSQEVALRQARVEVEEPLPSVLAHPAVLVQIVANLIGNAVKFVAAGTTPHLRIRAERRGACARVWVEDNGIGIKPEHQERIFRVFERLHGQESFPGTGVGLAIVKKGCERMGGRCGVESRPGAGSRFWFELPTQGEEGPSWQPQA